MAAELVIVSRNGYPQDIGLGREHGISDTGAEIREELIGDGGNLILTGQAHVPIGELRIPGGSPEGFAVALAPVIAFDAEAEVGNGKTETELGAESDGVVEVIRHNVSGPNPTMSEVNAGVGAESTDENQNCRYIENPAHIEPPL